MLIAGGNLIRKVLFPAEVLPIVTVLAGLVHFCLGLPILAAFLVYFGVAGRRCSTCCGCRSIVLVQLLLTLGLALLLSALTVHFRDLRDLLANLLTLWFFATPIIYPLSQVPDSGASGVLGFNPFTHLAVAYQEVLLRRRAVTSGTRAWSCWRPRSLAVFLFGYFVFDRLRDTLAEEV